ncbi:MAG: GNAT family N-acetyltransferase [Eubacteriales bacterium]
MQVDRLEVIDHVQTRTLWEEVFQDDTEAFLDYYYKCMADHNTIYTIEQQGELVSMLQLNPYQIQLAGKLFPIHYIVGVATKERYRKQGMMGKLLRQSMQEMYLAKEPLTYLMPAAEAIYEPYDFVVVGEQIHYEYVGELKDGMFVDRVQNLEFSYATDRDCAMLTEFANQEIMKRYSIFTRRTEEYFQQLIKEQACQNGGIVLVRKEGVFVGYFITANEGYQQIRELIFSDDIKMPVKEKSRVNMMVRIVNLEKLLTTIRWGMGEQNLLQVIDPIIEENTGTYRFSPSYGGLRVKKISNEVDKEQAWTIRDLTKNLFEDRKVLLNEIV